MPDNPATADLSPAAVTGSAIDALLARLRDQIRGAIGRRLAWQAAAALGLVLWMGLTLDRLIEPSAQVRATLNAALALGAVGWLGLVALPRWFHRITDHDLLTLLHHDHPREATLLSTALDLRRLAPPPNRQLANEAIEAANQAAVSLEAVRLDRHASTMGSAWFATAALGGAALLGIARPDLSACLVDRVALSEKPWPRQVTLVAEGFTFDEATGDWTLIAPRGEALEFAVVAETSREHPLPRTVWARGGAEGRRVLTTLTRVGQPSTGETKRQRFRRRIERLDTDQTLVIRGGDARQRLRIVAAERPRLIETRFTSQPPNYLNTPAFTVEPTTLAPLPEGSRLTLEAQSTKPLDSTDLSLAGVKAPQPLEATLVEGGHGLVAELPPLEASRVLTLTLLDQDGLASEPIRLPLEVAADTPPTVRLTLDGIGRAVTRDARLRVRAAVDDDHGLDGTALLVSLDAGEPIRLDMAPPIGLPGEATGEADLLTLRSAAAEQRLAVKPGDRVMLVATASDRYDLANREPTASQPIVLEVVSPAELLARLGDAQRELRRGVESLQADVERLAYELDLAQRRFAEGDPPSQDDLRRWASERLLDTRKAADGVATVADRGEGLRQQVLNNRLDQPALVDRLTTAVVGPLRRVVDRDLRQTRERLTGLEPSESDAAIADSVAAAGRAAETLGQVAASLDSQQTYNEVVALLRGLIREQRTVNEKTARQETEDARSLLLD